MMHRPDPPRFRALTGLAAATLTLLAGCSILPRNESLAVYNLPATPIITETAGNSPGDRNGNAGNNGNADGASTRRQSLRVATPSASAVLDTDHIAVLPEPNLIKNYQGVRWSDRAPVLLRNRLMTAFTGDGRIRYPSTDDAIVQADLELGGDLRAFQTEYRGGAPSAVIVFDARLVQAGSKRIVAMRNFSVAQPIDGVKVPQAVAAFGLAADRLSIEVMDWTVAQMARMPTITGADDLAAGGKPGNRSRP